MSEWKETDIGLIPHDWEVVKFSEILQTTLRNGVNKPSRVRGIGDYKMVNMNEIFAHDVIKDIPMEFVELNDNERTTSLLEKNDLLFARQSLVFEGAGKCSIYVGDNEKVCFEGHLIRARLNSEKSNSEFYYYFFSSSYGKRFIRTIIEQAVVAGIRGSDLKELQIPYPPKQQQDGAVGILSCLDRKIENLRKQNETLEAIAQTLFKHWFVDFEFPNEDGKPYKSSGGAMVRSELGEIPAGWRVVRMEEIADRIAMGPFGSRITTDNFVNSGVPVIRGGNLVNGFNEREFVYLTEEKADELKSSNAFPEDIVFTHRGTLGQVGFIPTHSEYRRYVVSQSQMLLGVNKNLISPRFVYRFFCSQVGMNVILSNTNTTGVPSIGRPTTTLKSIQTAMPEDKVMYRFDALMKGIDFKKEANNRQIQTLTKTRDVLLPQLMSGKLRITE